MSRKPSSRNTMLSALMTGQATPSKDAKDGPLPPREEHLHPRVSAGAVGALRNTLAHITKDGRVVELDPTAIDPSPYPDRLGGAEDSAAIEQLAASIARNGQEVPVLVRPHPERANRYQTIYGHRRVRAIAGLGQGQKVRAIVRDLTDEELLIAQGIENSARQDLSWIEKALFARRLEIFARESGKEPTAMVMEALSMHAPDVSRFRTTLEVIPEDVILAIGPAPKTGRTKWLALYNLVKADAKVLDRVRAGLEHEAFRAKGSDDRFAEVLRLATAKADVPGQGDVIIGSDSQPLATVERRRKAVRFTLSDPGFARFLEERMAGLHADYLAAVSKD